MKIKFKNWLLFVLIAVCSILCCLTFMLMIKPTKAQAEVSMEEEQCNVCYDIKNGMSGSCYSNEGFSLLSLDNKNSCLDHCTTHGPGREKGGKGLLNTGCRNYMGYNFNYGSSDIPYWINMDSINAITNSAHRNKILSDIRNQAEMWNYACMYDGTGQIVNIYEYNSSSKPSSINGKRVIEVSTYDYNNDGDLNNDNYAGAFYSGDFKVDLNYDYVNGNIGYNIDTIVHEFGHILGLMDLEYIGSGISRGTHKTLMGYDRNTTTSTLNAAIKYQDIQGIAVMTGRHVCKDYNFVRYVKVGNEYRHICFYCDRIDNRKDILPDSKEMEQSSGCSHEYYPIVCYQDRRWDKCIKCYNVKETVQVPPSGYNVTLNAIGNITTNYYVNVLSGQEMPYVDIIAPKKTGYVFDGYYDTNGKKYYEMKPAVDVNSPDLHNFPFYPCIEKVVPVKGVKWTHTTNMMLYARWKLLECDYTYQNVSVDKKLLSTTTVHLKSGKNTISPIGIRDFKFKYFEYYGRQYSSNPAEIDIELYCDYRGIIDEELRGNQNYSDGIFLKEITCEVKPKYVITAVYEDDSCLAEGSLITLADGSQVAVENLTGNEMLLVWNLYTGAYDTAPILFIDKDPLSVYKVINLTFSDGTTVKVISEHGFWDYNLNKYVYIDENNADSFIGHWFNKGQEKIQLKGVEIKEEQTAAYSPVTAGHLCYFVNGMLSMPGGIDGLFNIFDVDAETMKYDEVSMQLDIESYGLFTYEEFITYLNLPEEVFEAFNAQYFKVAIGKGLITVDRLSLLYERYAELLA